MRGRGEREGVRGRGEREGARGEEVRGEGERGGEDIVGVRMRWRRRKETSSQT